MSVGRILIVDDDPQIRRVLKIALSGEGYEVKDVRSGEDAELELRDSRYDLMLLDMNMPGMGGWKPAEPFARVLRSPSSC